MRIIVRHRYNSKGFISEVAIGEDCGLTIDKWGKVLFSTIDGDEMSIPLWAVESITPVSDAFTFHTYADLLIDADTGEENELYDVTLREFTVPVDWFYRWVYEEDGRSWKDFINEYTWDDTLRMYDQALRDGAVMFDEIVPR